MMVFWSCVDVIVVRVKVNRIVAFSPMGIDSGCGHWVNRPVGGDLHEQITHTSK
jgi:hypothetical protein